MPPGSTTCYGRLSLPTQSHECQPLCDRSGRNPLPKSTPASSPNCHYQEFPGLSRFFCPDPRSDRRNFPAGTLSSAFKGVGFDEGLYRA